MAWESFSIGKYEVFLIADNTKGLEGTYGFINLYWQGQYHAKIWFYRGNGPTKVPNASYVSGGFKIYYAYFQQAQFHDSIDLLRNEKPVYFQWNEATKGAYLATSQEPVGEEELP